MSIRPIKHLSKAKPTVEGAGVHLRRAFGFGNTSEFDPFLLLDDSRNDVPEDYLAGLPWHPHRERKLHFPLLSDFEPKGAVAQAYGVYRKSDGITERALFVIDGNGLIHWSYVSPIGVNPGAAGILAALETLPAKKKPKSQKEAV